MLTKGCYFAGHRPATCVDRFDWSQASSVSLPEHLSTLLAAEPGHSEAAIGLGTDRCVRQQSAVWAFGRRATSRPDLQLLIQDAVSLVTEIVEGELGGASEVTADDALEARLTTVDTQGRAIPVAAHRSTLDPATSITACALSTASTVVSANLASEKRFADPFLREQGIVSGLVVPLPVDDKPFGTIGVFCRKTHEFRVDDIRFVETIANLLSSSIARSRAEEQSRRGKSLADAVLESVAEMVITLDGEGRLIGLNRATRLKTGYKGGEVRGQAFSAVFLQPEDTGAFADALRAVRSGAVRFSVCLLTKTKEVISADWQLQPVELEGRELCIVLTGCEVEAEQQPRPFAPTGTEKPSAELRSSPRRVFQYRQRIAPMYTGVIPRKHELFEVDCRDISAGGLSFYLEHEPDFRALIVGLGRDPDVTYFTARVMRVGQERVGDKVRYLVGCRLTGRVQV